MAVHTPGVWGIDLGQCALKAMRLEMKDGQVVATAFDYIEHPKILSQPDADPDQLTREALEQFLSRNSLRGDMVVISVPGQSGLARFVKLPPVEEKKIADIVRFEAKQQIPFPLEEVVWDFQKLSSGSLSGDFVETEIGLFAMKREMVNRSLSQFKDVNVEVHVIQMAPLALCNFVAYDQLKKSTSGEGGEGEPEVSGKKQCVVALDMGTDSSNLVITDGGKIIWQRPIPIGGNHFTRALTKDLKLTFAKAEHLKRNAAKSPDLRKILAALKSVLNDFVGEVQRSLGYFTNTHRDAQIKYIVGLGNAFRLPGLKQYLQEKLQLEVRKLGKFERLGGESVTAAPTFAENIMSFGVTYGLALQGLKQTRLHTNLLPHEVRMERLVRGKKPWAAAAAAVLLVGVAGVALLKGIENGHVTGASIIKAQGEAKGTLDAVAKAKAEFDAEEARITKSKENLEKLGAGTPERLNWQLLHEYINFALPLPNGERLAEEARDRAVVKKKFNDTNAVKALRLLEARRFPDLKQIPDKEKAFKDDQFIKKHLVQVNIEGVMSLYSEDLQPYFKKIHADGDVLFGMDEADKKRVVAFATGKDQEGKDLPKIGWVIEIRGYTYHQDEMVFVRYSLLENLFNPEYRRNLAWFKAQPPEVQEQFNAIDKAIRERIGYIFVYQYQKVLDPQPGQFAIIGQSQLRSLVSGGDAGGVGGIGGVGGRGEPGGPGAPKAGPVGGADDRKGGADVGAGAPRGGGAGDSWSPIGDIASSVLGGGGGFGGFGGFPGAAGPRGFGGAGPRGALGGLGGPGGPGGPGSAAGPPVGLPKSPTAVGGDPRAAAGKPKGDVATGGPGGLAADEKKAAVVNVPLQPRTEFVILFVWREPLPASAQAPPGDEQKTPAPAPENKTPAPEKKAGGENK
jgi:type IV pilus assembly protein PilM